MVGLVDSAGIEFGRVVDGKVVAYGKVLKKDEAKALIRKVRG